MGMHGSCWRITPADWAELQGLADRQAAKGDWDVNDDMTTLDGEAARVGKLVLPSID